MPLHGHKPNPEMEALTEDCFDAPDLAAQKAITERMQLLAFEDPPFIPVGQYLVPQAHRASVTQFWNVKKG